MTVDLKRILHNYNILKKAAKGAEIYAVVKNNAYGLGMSQVAKHLFEEADCHDFFVARLCEAVKLRQDISCARIYVLEGITQDDADVFIKLNLTPIVNTLSQVEICAQNKIKCAANVETGLNRLGLYEKELLEVPKDIRHNFLFIMSHLGCSGAEEHPLNQTQLLRIKELRDKYIPNIKVSLCATSGIFLEDEFTQDIVRVGAGLYGIKSSLKQDSNLLPVISIKAPILQVAKLKAGETIGYSATCRAKNNMETAIVGVGYGDGLFRSLSNRGGVIINNQIAPIVGRISMDLTVVDITGMNTKPGDYAYILNDEYTVNNMAADAGTIGYEILPRFGNTHRVMCEYKK
jgi:alanine racemase